VEGMQQVAHRTKGRQEGKAVSETLNR
jgi:hypothetical protein